LCLESGTFLGKLKNISFVLFSSLYFEELKLLHNDFESYSHNEFYLSFPKVSLEMNISRDLNVGDPYFVSKECSSGSGMDEYFSIRTDEYSRDISGLVFVVEYF